MTKLVHDAHQVCRKGYVYLFGSWPTGSGPLISVFHLTMIEQRLCFLEIVKVFPVWRTQIRETVCQNRLPHTQNQIENENFGKSKCNTDVDLLGPATECRLGGRC